MFFPRMFLLLFLGTVGGMLTAQDDFLLGATTHFASRKGVVDANLSLFKDAGMNSTRDDAPWRYWDPAAGVYRMPPFYAAYLERAFEMELNPLQIIAYQNTAVTAGYPKTPEAIEEYTKCAEAIVTRYKGRGRLYQIWNEWDGGCGMESRYHGNGDPAGYVNLLKKVYPRLKRIDPGCVIIANSVCTGEKFLEETFKLGVLNYCDGFSFHAYNHGAVGEKSSAEAFIRRIRGVIELAKKYNGGVAKPFYLTEIGWPNNTKRGGAESLIADYVARVSLLARTMPEVKGLWWYDFQDDGYNPEENENNFGMVLPDLTPKEPFFVMRSLAGVIRNAVFLRRIATDDPNVFLLCYRMPDGSEVLATWTTRAECRTQILLNRGTAPDAPLQLQVAGHAQKIPRRWGYREWVSAADNRLHRDQPEAGELFSVTVSGRPVLLYGKSFEGVKVASVRNIDRTAKTAQGKLAIPGQVIDAVRSGTPAAAAQTWESIGGNADYRRLTEEKWNGAQDFSAKFKLNYDDSFLYLTLAVRDDIHAQAFQGGEMWKGDSLQIAFAALRPYRPAPVAGTEYLLALTGNGPEIRRDSTQFEQTQPTQVKFEAERADGVTTYRLRFPLAELGIAPLRPGMPVGMSIVVNESDGAKRKGYLHWGDGIGSGHKNPEEYNWIILR